MSLLQASYVRACGARSVANCRRRIASAEPVRVSALHAARVDAAQYTLIIPSGAAVSHEPRIESLEIKVAHLERALQELSDVLFRQQQLIDVQNARHLRLLERLESADASGPSESQFEVPPHY